MSKQLDIEDFPDFKLLDEGLSNTLYVSVTEGQLLRFYGSKSELCDRETEIQIMTKVGQLNLGPKIITIYPNGRIEQFLIGYHSIGAFPNNVKLAKSVKVMKDFHDIKIGGLNKKPMVIKQLELWSQMAQELDTTNEILKDLCDDISVVIDKINEMCEHDKLVLCHNDLTYGNILMNRDGIIKLVDFEYSGLNYREYDIANFINELEFEYCKDGTFKYQKMDDEYIYELIQTHYGNVDIDKVKFFRRVSHLIWGMWSLIQYQKSDIEFDYLSHASIRFELFRNIY